jgi:hypothetical protein
LRYYAFMHRTSWLLVAYATCCACFAACGDDASTAELADAGDPATPFDPPPDSPRDDGGMEDALDATTPDAADPFPEPDPDPDPERDAAVRFDCAEEFVWDPAGRGDVVTVVVASPLSSWSPPSSPSLALGADGLWRASLPMNAQLLPYKFVINGSEWIADPAACHRESDGFGGQNSLRYACQDAPACPSEPDAGLPIDAGSDAGELDAGSPDASAPDASAPDSGADMDASSEPDAAQADAGDGGVDPECPCHHTAWIDVDDKPGVVADDILEVVLTGGHPALGQWDPGFSSVVLSAAGEGIWYARVAPPAALTEYKVVVRHKQHPPAWLLDEGNCLALASGNNVLHACDSQPAVCTPAVPAPSLPGSEVDLCTRCEVEVTIPFTAIPGLTDTTSVVLQGEQAPLGWGSSFALTRGDGAFSVSFEVPRGRHEYQMKIGDAEFGRDPVACGATPNGANSFLYGCYEAPGCD